MKDHNPTAFNSSRSLRISLTNSNSHTTTPYRRSLSASEQIMVKSIPVSDLARNVQSAVPLVRERKYPIESAGPFKPTAPLSSSIIRIIPGNPRFGTAPLKWFSQSPTTLTCSLSATISYGREKEASIELPFGGKEGAKEWFEFEMNDDDAQYSNASITFELSCGGLRARYVSSLSEFSKDDYFITRLMTSHTGFPVALLTLSYLHVTQFSEAEKLAPFDPFLPKFSGHRGCGGSGPEAPWRPLENSMESYLSAAFINKKCQAIELDVQITKDNEIVIYHNWFLQPKGFTGNTYDENVVQIPLYDVTFEEANAIYKSNYSHLERRTEELDGKGKRIREIATEAGVKESMFDVKLITLKEVLDNLPESIGIFVELKYPPLDVSQGRIPYPERNSYVNAVLGEINNRTLNSGRQIAYLSFDADLCLMLKMKQMRHPVYLSHCNGVHKPCDEYDPRLIDIKEGYSFVQTQNLDGMMMYNKLLEDYSDDFAYVANQGCPIITYGVKNSDPDFVREQFAVGVQGVIADDVDILLKKLDLSS